MIDLNVVFVSSFFINDVILGIIILIKNVGIKCYFVVIVFLLWGEYIGRNLVFFLNNYLLIDENLIGFGNVLKEIVNGMDKIIVNGIVIDLMGKDILL